MNNRIQEIMDLEHFKTLTPIQEQVLNRKNKNRDIIGVSSTGSGKSHAFFVPIFEMLDFDQDCVQAVISAPTRELAYQLPPVPAAAQRRAVLPPERLRCRSGDLPAGRPLMDLAST